MKKLFSTVLCVLMLFAFCVTGLSAGGTKDTAEAAGGQITVRMTYWNQEETMADLLAYLAKQVPDVKIEYQFIDNTNYATLVDTQLAAGEGPDIIVEAGNSAQKHAQLGYLADVSSLASKFSAAGNSIFTYNGKVYALPGVSWFEGIWYNKDIFAKNNLALPKTFGEYIELCKKLQDLGIKPLAAGLKSWEPMLKNSMALVTADYLSKPAGANFGANYRSGNATLEGTWDPYIKTWSAMITEGIYVTDMTGIDHEQAMEEFTSGKAAMFCSGPWDLEAILAKNPNLNLGMMPFQGSAPSDGWLIGGPGGGFAVNAKSPNKDAAMRVLEAIASPEAQKMLVADSEGGSSYLMGVETGLPAYYDDVETTLMAGNVYCPWDEWGTAGSAHLDYGVEFQKYLMGEQDIAETLGNVDAVVQELLSK
jgi:raffinose/stachyose/melibiose transport system substrate-binding protein